ncbi:hypothetical protein [uncultured Aquimarina sp.]|uniref:hypothetical protein n=1 Tax=uncultured Aquimarina sp. TaxID=575652 RepID=UPI00261E7C57|nr:hypothetical protein [uncultured Aquimarina sp.]
MKQYRPTFLYAIKIFGLVVGAGFSIFIISIFLDIVTFFVESSFFEKAIFTLLIVAFVFAAFLIIRSNRPTISFYNDYMIIGRQEVTYDIIKNFYPAKGGSEPYIVTKDEYKIDLEISWFRKKDRAEIEKIILEKIQPLTKQS